MKTLKIVSNIGILILVLLGTIIFCTINTHFGDVLAFGGGSFGGSGKNKLTS